MLNTEEESERRDWLRKDLNAKETWTQKRRAKVAKRGACSNKKEYMWKRYNCFWQQEGFQLRREIQKGGFPFASALPAPIGPPQSLVFAFIFGHPWLQQPLSLRPRGLPTVKPYEQLHKTWTMDHTLKLISTYFQHFTITFRHASSRIVTQLHTASRSVSDT